METVHCQFERLRDCYPEELLHAYGVYVLWSGKSRARPSYIGEGDIWARLEQHRRRFPRPIDGYVAVFGDEYRATTKRDIQIVESVLLAIGEAKDRFPRHNRKRGNIAALDPLFNNHGVVKVFFGGWDPFLEPGTGAPLKSKRIVSLSEEGDGYIRIEHSWRLRRLRNA